MFLVQPLGVVNTRLERARLYLRYRPTPVILLADPETASHRAFGVPAVELVSEAAGGRSDWPRQETPEHLMTVRINPTGELLQPVNVPEANERLNQLDGFQMTEADQHIWQAHGTQLIGHFLVDRDGVVRWRHLEAERRPDDLGSFPTDAEFLAAVRGIVG